MGPTHWLFPAPCERLVPVGSQWGCHHLIKTHKLWHLEDPWLGISLMRPGAEDGLLLKGTLDGEGWFSCFMEMSATRSFLHPGNHKL